MDIIEESELNIKDACEKAQLNPDRYHRWKRRFDANGLDGLKNRNSALASRPHKLLEEEKETIIDYALEHPDLRHRKLAYEMPR